MKPTINSRALALTLLLALALAPLFALSSCGEPQEQPDVPDTIVTPSYDLHIYSQGVTSYALLVRAQRSTAYQSALDRLIAAFESAFGIAPEIVEYNGEGDTDGDAGGGSGAGCADADADNADSSSHASASIPDDKGYTSGYIVLGNLGSALAAEDKAADALSGEGYCIAAEDGDLAIYATSDVILLDAVELFADHYVARDRAGGLTVDGDINLMRRLSGTESTDVLRRGLTCPVLTVNTENGEEVNTRSRYVRARVSLINVYSDLAFEDLDAQIRGRGNGTWTNIPKKPYKLKFDSKINLLGIGGSADRDWVLLSNPLDYTSLRNYISLELARSLFGGISYVPACTFVNLYLNGEYRGLYLLCEQIEVNSHKVIINESADSVSGSDYFVEIDYYASSDRDLKQNVDYFVLEGKNIRIISDYNSVERCMYVNQTFASIFAALRSGERDQIEKYFDLTSTLDTYILYEFMKNTDVGWSSFYMVLRAGGKLEFTAPWDFDLSSGNDYRVDDFSPELLYVGARAGERNPALSRQESPIFYLLMDTDWFAPLVSERLAELGSSILDNALSCAGGVVSVHYPDFENDIELRLREYTSSTAKKNYSDKSSPAEVFDDNYFRLLSWLEQRDAWLSDYFGVD